MLWDEIKGGDFKLKKKKPNHKIPWIELGNVGTRLIIGFIRGYKRILE